MAGRETSGVDAALPPRTAARPTDGRARGVPGRDSIGCTGCPAIAAAAAAYSNSFDGNSRCVYALSPFGFGSADLVIITFIHTAWHPITR